MGCYAIGLMRIIAGEHRGRRLLAPEGDATRPITDRVKQSLFDILAPRIESATVYDCFAGTGSMGLECLSRGAERAIFIETDRSAIARLRKNIAAIREERRSQVIPTDVFRYFADKTPLPLADLVFLDPPYRFLTERREALVRLADQLALHLKADAVVVFRHDAADRLELPALERCDERTYGGMALEFLRLGPLH
jgi:16S rRNA (guanine966-N2)-methyltransferase